MTQNHIVYLIGFMGCGKTTVGKKLAASLKWKFIDLDEKIEEKTELTISDIFATLGEEYFREIEAATLRELTFNSNCVVAVGGGTPCFKENMNFMFDTGYTIYLKLTPMQLAGRLKVSVDNRPLIQNVKGMELLDFIGTKLTKRSKWYKKSHLTINGFRVNIPLVTKRILSYFDC